MLVKHEVGKYEVQLMSGYGAFGGTQIGFVYLYEASNRYIGYAGIIKDEAALPGNIQHANGVINLYFHEAELVPLLDTLRNESPVYVQIHSEQNWGSVGTGREPVGEEETPAGS